MKKQCKQCLIEFIITQADLDFYDKISPVFAGKKYKIPEPNLCPTCRQQRRLAQRNERILYNRKCDLSGEDIMSNYSVDKQFIIYEQEKWWGDNWDCLSTGRDFDFNKSFFEQFLSLLKMSPVPSRFVGFNTNCPYVNYVGHCKNCHLIFDSDYCEDSYYSNVIKYSQNLLDCSFCKKSKFLYEAVNCSNCYDLKFALDCNNCSNSYFLKDCVSCKNCIFCSNLRNKEYYIENKKASKEQYDLYLQNLINDLNTNNGELMQKFANMISSSVARNVDVINSESVTGNYIYNSQNIIDSFDIGECKDCSYCDTLYKANDCFDVSSFGEDIEFNYDSTSSGHSSQRIYFSNTVVSSSDIYYSFGIWNCSNCFGCVGLNGRKSYCILNKQYSKEEYEILVPKIIEHMKKTHSTSSGLSYGQEWGEFFPVELSPFTYNETVAQEYFPLTSEEVGNTYSKLLFDDNASAETRLIAPIRQDHNGSISKGWKWKEQNDQIQDVEKIIPAEKLPNNIKDIPDDILNWAIKCKISKRPFKIIPQELKFYREHSIPIPHLHPDKRHEARMKLRNSRKIYNRKCMNCEKDMKTTYSHERSEIVYCEECYLMEVY